MTETDGWSVLVPVTFVVLVGLAGCVGSLGIDDADDVLYPDGAAGASAQTTFAETESNETPSTAEPAGGGESQTAEVANTGATNTETTITSAAPPTTGTETSAPTETTTAEDGRQGSGSDTGSGDSSGTSNSADDCDESPDDPQCVTGTPTGTPGDTTTATPSTEDESLPEVPEHEDSTFDVAHSQNIASNGDGTTTVEGYVVSTDDHGPYDGLVVVVEIYDHDGNWIGSEWVEIGSVTRNEETPYSVTFDVPRDEIGDYAADVNGVNYFEGDEHYNAPGQCVEISGDGPNDEEAEWIDRTTAETDDGTVVVGSVHNGATHDMAFVRIFVSIYDESGNQLATETALVEDVPRGEVGQFAVPFDETDVHDVRIDADEMAIADGELKCRPPH